MSETGCLFRLLRPVQVEVSGRPLSFPRPQQMDLLCFLLLHRDRMVTVEQLIDAMWGEAVPRSAPTGCAGLRALGDPAVEAPPTRSPSASRSRQSPVFSLRL